MTIMTTNPIAAATPSIHEETPPPSAFNHSHRLKYYIQIVWADGHHNKQDSDVKY